MGKLTAKCPNGCDAGFTVKCEVMNLDTLLVSSTGEIEDTIDSDPLDDPDPFTSDDWECVECGDEPDFIEETPPKKKGK